MILTKARRYRDAALPTQWPAPTFGPPPPALARPVVLDAAPLLGVALMLAYALPPRLVVNGLGAAGRPAIILGFGLLVWWTASRAVPGLTTYGRQPVRWLVAAFMGAYLLSYVAGYRRVLDAQETSSADRTLLVTLALVGFALATADGVSTRARLDRLLRSVLVFASFMAVVGELQFLFRIDLTQYIRVPGLSLNSPLIGVGERGGPAFARVAGTAGHYIEYGVILAMLLPLAIHYLLFARTRGERINRAILVVVLGAGIPFSISRSAIIALAAGLLVLLPAWTLRRQFNALVLLVIFTVGFRALQPGLLGTIRSLFSNVENDPSIQNRTSDFEVVERYFSQRPWLGVGQGSFTPENGVLLDNQYLGTVVAGGLLGLVTLLVLFFGTFSLARRIRRTGADEETQHLGQTFAAMIIVAVVASFTFDAFAFSTFTATLFLIIGATGALWRLDRTDPERGTGHRPERPVLRTPHYLTPKAPSS